MMNIDEIIKAIFDLLLEKINLKKINNCVIEKIKIKYNTIMNECSIFIFNFFNQNTISGISIRYLIGPIKLFSLY
jgi:hypothetical protein